MTFFVPRKSAPDATDKNWIRYSMGGLNYCIPVTGNSVLPNCVGYAWGRWLELMGPTNNRLSRGNAENWFTKVDGYERGQTPKLGAIACWRKGQAGVESDGAGHVSVVEDILEDGSIVTSNSAWGGSTFYTRTVSKPYSVGSTYVFQGFIYPPIDFVKKPEVFLKSIDVVAKEVINGVWGNGGERKARLTAAGYNYSLIQAKVNQILSAPKAPKKSIDEIAREVINGKWNNGEVRKKALTAAGYDYYVVQARVRELLKR